MKEEVGTGTGMGREGGPGPAPELEGGGATATVCGAGAGAGGGGMVRLAGNQPTDKVLWFWPLHSDISRLLRPTKQ